MKKVIKDGKVAVLISFGFGGGFYSWGAPIEAIYDPTLVDLVLNKKIDDAVNYVEKTWPGIFTVGVPDLAVVWLDEGTEFIIHEYGGAESVQVYDKSDYLIA